MGLSSNFTKVTSFAKAIASRGLTNKKTDPFTKKLRVLGCFGDSSVGGEFPPCEHLRKSKTEGKFHCGGCGCGDRKGTWLIAEAEEYSKLDYPNMRCPLKMPGFSNYEISSAEESIEPITRRYHIEQLSSDCVNKIPVSTNEIPESVQKALQEAIQKNKDKSEND